MRDPRIDPRPGDVVRKWNQMFRIDRVSQGCVFVKPPLLAHRNWVGILYWLSWASESCEVMEPLLQETADWSNDA